MPRLPPVPRTLRIVSRQLSGRRDVERCDKADHGGHLVGGELRPAIGPNVGAGLLAAGPAAAIGPNDIGPPPRAGDRTAARFCARHPPLRVSAAYGFDPFCV